MDLTLRDIKTISSEMRKSVFNMAQDVASRNCNVIVTFGAGPFKEWREMMKGCFSYIAVDPDIRIDHLFNSPSIVVLPYDFTATFESQVKKLASQPTTVLWAKCKSEDFLDKTDAIASMALLGLPAVFSFSLSYHIEVIHKLWANNINLYGCGYVHDGISLEGVGRDPARMVPREDFSEMVSTFGPSVWIEPYLLSKDLPGVLWVRSFLPEIWIEMDAEVAAVMELAIIMRAERGQSMSCCNKGDYSNI